MKKRILFFFFLLTSLLARSQQSGTWFFNHPAIHEININFYETNYWDSLVAYKTEDNATGIEHYLAATVTVDSIVLDSVGIRLRGNSSYGHPGLKKPIQLDFNEFISGQKLNGLKKLNLNNGFLDPTMMREKLLLDIMKEENLPAPRCTFAKVYFNGTYVGLYKAMETVNDDFLDYWFGNSDGNLFKCEPNMTLGWEGNNQTAYYDNCEIKNNETLNDWTDLVHFIDLVNHTTSDNYSATLNPVFNLQSYLKYWAMQNLFGNLDSYMYLPHNYYLYHNTTTDKFEWITWDVSLAFGVYAFLIVPNSIDFAIDYLPNNAHTERPLNFFCLNSPELKADYYNYLCALLNTAFLPSVIFHRIDSIATVIRPAIYAEPDANQMFTEAEFEGNLGSETVNYQLIGQIPGLKDYVYKRRANVTIQLCANDWSCSLGTEFPSDGNNLLNIYPNPGNDKVTFEYAAVEENSAITLLMSDLNGHIIRDEFWILDPGMNSFTIDVNKLAQGVYFINSKSGCREVSKKLVIIR